MNAPSGGVHISTVHASAIQADEEKLRIRLNSEGMPYERKIRGKRSVKYVVNIHLIQALELSAFIYVTKSI